MGHIYYFIDTFVARISNLVICAGLDTHLFLVPLSLCTNSERHKTNTQITNPACSAISSSELRLSIESRVSEVVNTSFSPTGLV